MTRVSVRDAVVSVVTFAAALGGCQLLVPSDVPEFRCLGSAPSACPAGMVCDTVTSRCVQPAPIGDGGEDVHEDPPDASLDAADAGPSDLGGACINDRGCKAGLLCGGTSMLTPAIVETNGICTKTCCTSEDCPDSFICFGTGTGGSYCVPADKAQRSPTGARTAGESCGDGGECRSGLCEMGRCVDGCCSADDCAAGTTCRILRVAVPAPGRDTWACAAPEPGGLETGQSCGAMNCQNDNCAGSPLKCRPPCCTSAECVAMGHNLGVCAYGQILGSSTYEKWCVDISAKGEKAVGEPCDGAGECESLYCDFATKKCVAVCCLDEDCPDGEVCRPSPVTTPLLRCVRPEKR